jgi:STE24 endopeptidase
MIIGRYGGIAGKANDPLLSSYGAAMTSNAILLCYAALLILDLGWGLFLTALNYRRVRSHAGLVPEALGGRVSPEDASKAASYSMAKMRLGFVEQPAVSALTLAAVGLGLFGILDGLVGRAFASEYWRGSAFLGAVIAAEALLGSPFSLYSTFSLERRFGFNRTKPGTWLLDLLKSALLTVALGLPLLWLLYAFVDGAGRLWWLWAAAAFSVLDVLLSMIFPTLIAPLFNKFKSLPEGPLSARIAELTGRLGFRNKGVYVMDGSRRSSHSNAYFAGVGATRRIVLFDTLIENMGEDEILAVLAHEIGHAKLRHVLKRTVASVALSFAAFFALELMMGWEALYAAFGFAGRSKHALLLILGLVSGPATFFMVPAFSAWSRRHEHAADRFAAREVGPKPLSSALIRLNSENASNLWPHPLYSAWYYSHPTLVERLEAVAGE